MDTEKIKYDLKLYIEKADKLRNSNFVKRAIENSGVDLSMGIDKETVISRRGPDDENIEAFVLTFRFFIQDNESISLRKIKDVFHSELATENEKSSFDDARNQLNIFLDGNTMFNINGNITRRKLMDIFIYGGLSHANPEKKTKYDSWMDSNLLAPFMQNEFTVILFEVLNIVVFVRNLCEQILRRIEA